MQLKYSNYVAFSHFHGKAVNNSGLRMMSNAEIPSCSKGGLQWGFGFLC